MALMKAGVQPEKRPSAAIKVKVKAKANKSK
jgi:hypothetical protein